MTGSDFQRNFFPAENDGNIPEIAVFADFDWIFLYFSVFFHMKALFIAVPAIKHGLIFNESDFCSRDCLKIAGTADYRQKTDFSIFLEFLQLHLKFYMKFWTLMQNSNTCSIIFLHSDYFIDWYVNWWLLVIVKLFIFTLLIWSFFLT